MADNDPKVRDFQPAHTTASRSATDTTGLHASMAATRSRSTTAPIGRHGVFPDDFHSTNLQRPATFRTGDFQLRIPSPSGLRTRSQRAATVKAYNRPDIPNWEPGAEPGIDPSKEGDDDDDRLYEVYEDCEITVVDFSADQMETYDLDNSTLKDFLDKPRPDWVDCRWICVNGISWDVIKQLGNYKSLHPLAIEDMINRRSRTKADWYSDHAFLVLSLQKLVRIHHGSSSSYEHQDAEALHHESVKTPSSWSKLFGAREPKHIKPEISDYGAEKNGPDTGFVKAHSSTSPEDPVRNIRTLHSYKVHSKSQASMSRAQYMEANSALSTRDLTVSIEQVSMFLTSDNVVISFFERSAPDVIVELIRRLSSKDTIVRRSGDASMVVQSIIDAIVDLALPIAEAYEDAISTLEFEVLTDPDMSQPRKLYILSSEISLLRSKLAPIGGLIKALREHHADPYPTTPGLSGKPPTRHVVPVSTVEISSLAQTYLGDVDDHIIMLTNALDQMHSSAGALTDLLFNTMGAFTNESMKTLTIISIFFLPLTFLTGYFGQNFYAMWSIDNNTDIFFWYIAIPMQVLVAGFLLRGMILRLYHRIGVRRWIAKQASISISARRKREAAKQQPRHQNGSAQYEKQTVGKQF